MQFKELKWKVIFFSPHCCKIACSVCDFYPALIQFLFHTVKSIETNVFCEFGLHR